MHQEDNYAPIAAYEKNNGAIVGLLYIICEGEAYSLSAEEVINRMEETLENNLRAAEISSYVILYHSQFANDDNHTLANHDGELKAISIAYNFKNGEKGKIGLPYYAQIEDISYEGFHNFNQEENNAIFHTTIIDDKDYFQDKETVQVPVFENESGLFIKKANTLNLNNTWCGIFGFDSYRNQNGSQTLTQYFNMALDEGKITNTNHLTISKLEYADVTLKAITINGKPKTILPVINTDYIIDVENKEICEWENTENLEAIIKGKGKNTFGLSYFATDYAENREKYLSQKEHKIKISGIAFVLDSSDINNAITDEEIKYSEDFTGFMPNTDLLNYACFDFIGQLEAIKETFLLENNSLKGYVMKIKLINNPDIKDFFTIDIFVTSENCNIKEWTIGMKLTGMVQMQGQIAE